MELQARLADYAADNIAIFAISYDSVDVLATFTAKYGISFPLLADEGSQVIRRLGHLSRQFPEDHANYGAAYPATYILDTDGIVVEKRIATSERERETATGVLETRFGGHSSEHGSAATAGGEHVAVRAYLDSPTYRQAQRLRLVVELDVADGWHVYGEPIPDGYVPLTVAVAPLDGVTVGAVSAPDPQPFTVAGLDEQFVVHEGTFRLVVPLTFVEVAGDHLVRAEVRYQACSSTECLMPSTVSFDLPVRVLAHVERAT